MEHQGQSTASCVHWSPWGNRCLGGMSHVRGLLGAKPVKGGDGERRGCRESCRMVCRSPRVGEREGRKGKLVRTVVQYCRWGHISGEQAHLGSPAGPPLGAGSRWPPPVGLRVDFQVPHQRPSRVLLSAPTLCSEATVMCCLLALSHCLGLNPTASHVGLLRSVLRGGNQRWE